MIAPSPPDLERERVVGRSSAVFSLSLCVVTVGLVVAFSIAFAACNNALRDTFTGFGQIGTASAVKPIPIPRSACPSLRLVSAAAAGAASPWRDALVGSRDWKRFASAMTEPLAEFDAALGAAVPNVPDAVARDLSAVRSDVEVGRVELFDATSVTEYMNRADVVGGYGRLGHASALVGDACGITLAPPLPF